jgi:hypothetical protein
MKKKKTIKKNTPKKKKVKSKSTKSRSKLKNSKKNTNKRSTRSKQSKKRSLATTRRSQPRKTKSKIKKNTKNYKDLRTKINHNFNDPTYVKKYLERQQTHHLDNTQSKAGFKLKDLFSDKGYYRYMWFPFLLIIFTLLMNFFLELIVFTQIGVNYIYFAKNTSFFNIFVFLLFFINVLVYFYFGYIGAKKNFQFKKVFSCVINLTAIILILEIIGIFISYITFMKPFIIISFSSVLLQKLYLVYLILWSFSKAVIYLVITALSYLLFNKFKYLKL